MVKENMFKKIRGMLGIGDKEEYDYINQSQDTQAASIRQKEKDAKTEAIKQALAVKNPNQFVAPVYPIGYHGRNVSPLTASLGDTSVHPTGVPLERDRYGLKVPPQDYSKANQLNYEAIFKNIEAKNKIADTKAKEVATAKNAFELEQQKKEASAPPPVPPKRTQEEVMAKARINSLGEPVVGKKASGMDNILNSFFKEMRYEIPSEGGRSGSLNTLLRALLTSEDPAMGKVFNDIVAGKALDRNNKLKKEHEIKLAKIGYDKEKMKQLEANLREQIKSKTKIDVETQKGETKRDVEEIRQQGRIDLLGIKGDQAKEHIKLKHKLQMNELDKKEETKLKGQYLYGLQNMLDDPGKLTEYYNSLTRKDISDMRKLGVPINSYITEQDAKSAALAGEIKKGDRIYIAGKEYIF